ncbi:hypothetical protein, partial [Thioclava indica]|uniref:hypothetical protein n=1 Tax=Thioclava indica TaxID=1353528 RepID=UPI00056F785C
AASFLPIAGRYDPDPEGVVHTVLSAIHAQNEAFLISASADRIATLKAVEAQQPEAFSRLVRLAYLGYYSRADLRPLFGVGAHPVHPQGYNVPRETPDLLEALSAPVRARGRAYRATKDTKEPAHGQ